MKVMNSFTVRYAETDQMGIVHHSNYPVWFEAGRTEYFRKLGLSYYEIEKQGYLLPLTGMSCDFKKPVRYEDEILVTTKLISMTCVKVEFEYEILNNYSGDVCATGKTSHAWTNREFKPLRFNNEKPEIFDSLKRTIGVSE